MSYDEMATILGCSQKACSNGDIRSLLQTNPFVRDTVSNVERALAVTMESENSKNMWAMPSVRATIVLSTYLDVAQIVIEKLLGTICRSDLRRLESLCDDVHTATNQSDDHLNAINALVGAFFNAVSPQIRE